MVKLQEVLQWLHQSTKFAYLVQVEGEMERVGAMLGDNKEVRHDGFHYRPQALNFLAVSLFTRGSQSHGSWLAS
jgi:hypothetical protein